MFPLFQYIREDAAQAKKSYEDKYGSKGVKPEKAVSSSASSSGAGSKSSKGVEGITADMKAVSVSGQAVADAKVTVSPTRASSKSAKEQAWSKEEDYF